MTTTYRTASVDGLKVFYREAGDPKAPTMLPLHGFPTSAHRYRDLIPALPDREVPHAHRHRQGARGAVGLMRLRHR
jgi:pimeloyl-ACP methyl ester carboxylesterase